MLKKHMSPLSKGGRLVKHAGKGASEQTLPAPGAMQTLTAGNVGDRTMQNYAKAAPPVGVPGGVGQTPQAPFGDGNWSD